MKAYDRARGIAAVVAAARAADPNPDDPFELEALDELPFVQIPHWVPLAIAALDGPRPATKASAIALYNFLAMHLSMSRDDRYVWPTRDTLAALMGYSRADKISPFANLLIEVEALVVIKVPNGTGPEQRNVYRLRRNPPPGFTGHLLMSQIYSTAEGLTEAAAGVIAGGAVCPQSGVGVEPESGSVTTTTPNKNKEQQTPAPSARSAGDVRRTSAGSSARDESSSGYAASDPTGPVADVVGEEPAGGGVRGRQRSGGVGASIPAQRPAGGKQAPAGGTGARKPSPFPPELREAIYATERLLPPELRAVLAVKFPYGHLPNANRQVIAESLMLRSPAQLGERAARRWISYGYDRDHHDGGLRSPLGVVEELLRRTPYCPEDWCEDGTNIHTGAVCEACVTRVEQRRADRIAGKPVPRHRPPRLYRDVEECVVCDHPFPDDVPDTRVCSDCQVELDRGAAHINGTPEPEAPAEPEPEHCKAGPSSAYRAARAAKAAKTPAPF
ncbi:hypothetical protein [Streptomyces sp. H27-H5]|uniref:hypothetical protein n=1 Tax=Streptomyces sp. H27-H5 TaxID=2996460 RepID=UPI00226E97AE|nr:hypothetical protein [Streptomyces sp. H27-H5]MCY0957668.1 hypothetical protein [Streptomyces sp. H27-H5]